MSRPDLTINEATATGWLRAELYGDRDKAREHLHLARTVLGGLRSRSGVNERIASGEPGGFFLQRLTLPDGSRIEAITNDGHDTIRIYASSNEESHEEKPEHEEKDHAPYMWVGMKVNYSGARVPEYALQAMMIEPDTGPTRGIVNNGWGTTGWLWFLMLNFDDKDNPSMDEISNDWHGGYGVPDGLIDTVDKAMVAHFYNWGGAFFNPRMRPTDHCIGMYDLQQNSAFFFSKNGLRMYDVQANNGTFTGFNPDSYTPDQRRWSPYDPHLSDEQQLAPDRDYSGLILGEFYEWYRNAWDVTYVLDPDEDKRHIDADPRRQVQKVDKFLQTVGMVKGKAQVLDGIYTLAIFAYANDDPASSRPNEAITIPAEYKFLPDVVLVRSNFGDYEERLGQQRYTPMVVDVEIRLGRGGKHDHGHKTFNFTVTAPVYDTRLATTTPFGYDNPAFFDPCSGDLGYNPCGRNFAPLIQIDVKNRTAQLAPEQSVEPVLGGGTWIEPNGQHRSPAYIYVYGGVFPVASQARWDDHVEDAVFYLMEQITTGTIGFSIMSESAAHAGAALVGADPGNVYRINPVSGAVDNLGIPSTDPSYWAANDPPHDSTNFFWYYEHAVFDQNECRNTFGVLLYSVGQAYDASQNYIGMPGYTNPDCC